MNKKEISVVATEEQKRYLLFKYQKHSAFHYFKMAVKYRKQGDIHEAKFYWKFAKDACIECEKAFARWDAILHLKHLLNINVEKYINAVDEKKIANEKWFYENAFGKNEVDVKLQFVWCIKKTIMGGK